MNHSLNTEKFLRILLEADSDNTQGMSGGDNPTEKDADMSSNDMGEGDIDDAAENMDENESEEGSSDEDGLDSMDDSMGSDDGDSSGEEDNGMDNSGDIGSAGSEPVSDTLKKKRLFKDYKRLLKSIDKVMDNFQYVHFLDKSENVKKIFSFVEHKMKENYEEIITVMTEQYSKLSYKQLLTIFLYIKMATKAYIDIINSIYYDDPVTKTNNKDSKYT